MPKFSDRFKQLRTERRLSQQNLADQLGFSKSSVNMYERGEREPGLESMETINISTLQRSEAPEY